MEAFLLILLFVAVIAFFKKVSNFVYSVAIIDIFLRILDFIKYNVKIDSIGNFIGKYFPSNMISIIDKYTSGIISDILTWIYVIIMIAFEYFIIREFFRNKRL